MSGDVKTYDGDLIEIQESEGSGGEVIRKN